MQVTYKKILFSFDGSKLSAVALDHVITAAKAFNADVYVLEVVDSITKIVTAINSANMTLTAQEILDDVTRGEKKAAKLNVAHIKTKLEKAGVKNCVTLVREGDARDEIIAVAKEKACDLIIMSTHGRSGLRRALLGSVAEDVLRHSPCPVFLIPAKK